MATGTNTVREEAGRESDAVVQPLLTVIVPIYNEVSTLETILERVRESPVDKQIIVVDDGSTDGTAELLQELAGLSPIEVHFHEKNQGKGRAIRTALEHAEGQYTIIQDGDLEYDPQDYPKLLAPLLAGEADVVYGSRYLNKENNFSGRLHFDLGVKFLNLFLWLLYGKKITDEATCYKVFPTTTLRSMALQCERFEFCPEVTAKACRLNLVIREIPIRYDGRSVEQGKKIRLADGLAAVKTLLSFRGWNGKEKKMTTVRLVGDEPEVSRRGHKAILALGALAIVTAIGALVVDPGETPPLVLEPAEVVVGDVLVGTRKEVSFEIRNNSDRTIQLHGFKLGCTCTSAYSDSTSLVPGETARAFVKWAVGKKEGGQSTDVAVVYYLEAKGDLPSSSLRVAKVKLLANVIR